MRKTTIIMNANDFTVTATDFVYIC